MVRWIFDIERKDEIVRWPIKSAQKNGYNLSSAYPFSENNLIKWLHVFICTLIP